MALIICVDCGGKLSDKAEACPHCGCPIEASMAKPSAPTVKTPPLPAQKPPPQKQPPASIDPSRRGASPPRLQQPVRTPPSPTPPPVPATSARPLSITQQDLYPDRAASRDAPSQSQPPLQQATTDSPQEPENKAASRAALYFCLLICACAVMCMLAPYFVVEMPRPGRHADNSFWFWCLLICFLLWQFIAALIAARAAARAASARPTPPSHLGPWHPQVLMPFAITAGILGISLGVAWMGLVTAWNWWRCGRVARTCVPAMVAVLALLLFGLCTSGAMNNVEISDGAFFLLVWGFCVSAAAILCFDLWQQRSAIRLREESRQQIGFHLLPGGIAVLIIMGECVVASFLAMFGTRSR